MVMKTASAIRKPWFLLEEYHDHPPLLLYDFIRDRGKYLETLTGCSLHSALLYRNGTAYALFERRSFLRTKRYLFRKFMENPALFEKIYRYSDRSIAAWTKAAAAMERGLRKKQIASTTYDLLRRSMHEITMIGQPVNVLVFDEDRMFRYLLRYLRGRTRGNETAVFSSLTNPLTKNRAEVYRRYHIDTRHRWQFELAVTAIRSKQRRYRLLLRHNALQMRIARHIATMHRIPLDRILSSDEDGISTALVLRTPPIAVLGASVSGVMFIDGQTIPLAVRQTNSMLNHIKRVPTMDGTLSGQCAVPGKVQGTVRIVTSPADINKVHKGNVLVSHTTTADLLPAVKKAAAIVTDMGGITCHAAIVSRELNIPCVIGTKVATKVLHDGDLVEVDANHGRVRKLR